MDKVVPQLSMADERTLLSAEQSLISECMSKAGFEYDSDSPDTILSAEDRDWALRSKVGNPEATWSDPELATTVGYGIDPEALRRWLESMGTGDASIDSGKALTEKEQAYATALGGTEIATRPLSDGSVFQYGVGGCASKANEALYGDHAEWVYVRHYVSNAMPQRLETALSESSAYQSASQEWRTCMRTAGFDEVEDNPESAYALAMGAYDDGRDGKAEEIALATADVGCQGDVDLMTMRRSIEKEAVRQLEQETPEEIVRFLEMRAAALVKARQVLQS